MIKVPQKIIGLLGNVVQSPRPEVYLNDRFSQPAEGKFSPLLSESKLNWRRVMKVGPKGNTPAGKVCVCVCVCVCVWAADGTVSYWDQSSFRIDGFCC